MGKIVTLGEVVADVYKEDAPSPVERPFTARPGGAPANVAVAAARLGVEAGFVGRLGDDLFGDFILEALDASGVDTSAILREEPPTRTTLAFVEIFEDGDREFTFYRSVPAADELLSPEDIKPESLEGASFANFGSIPLIKDPVRSATRRFAELANELDVAVAFDVNLRANLWDSLDVFRQAVEPLIDLSTVLKLSEDELDPVVGVDDPGEAADRLLDRGVSMVLVSMGGEGAFYATGGLQGRGAAVPARTRSWTPRARATPSSRARCPTYPRTPAGSRTRRQWARRCAGAPLPARWPAPSSARCRACPRGKSSRASWRCAASRRAGAGSPVPARQVRPISRSISG